MTEHFDQKPIAYTHNFRRYPRSGEQIDRLDQVLQHGILSPRQAKRLGVPLERDAKVYFEGVKDYEDIIFLFPLQDKKANPDFAIDQVSIYVDPKLPIMSVSEMTDYQEGNWTQLSYMSGEAYMFGSIQPKHFQEIVLKSGSPSEVTEAQKLLERHQPSLVDTIKIRSMYAN